jgi:hypothetical protein
MLSKSTLKLVFVKRLLRPRFCITPACQEPCPGQPSSGKQFFPEHTDWRTSRLKNQTLTWACCIRISERQQSVRGAQLVVQLRPYTDRRVNQDKIRWSVTMSAWVVLGALVLAAFCCGVWVALSSVRHSLRRLHSPCQRATVSTMKKVV